MKLDPQTLRILVVGSEILAVALLWVTVLASACQIWALTPLMIFWMIALCAFAVCFEWMRRNVV